LGLYKPIRGGVMTIKTKTHKSIIGQLRKKYGLKDNTPIHKVEQTMTPKDWQAFSEALTFPNGKPSQKGKWWEQRKKYLTILV